MKKVFSLNEAVIEYEEMGVGPVLVLLHGYGGNSQHWKAVAKTLSRHFRVVIPSLSHLYVSPAKLYTFKEQVMILDRFIQEVGYGDSVHVAGASFGGALAWALAIYVPSRISSLTLLSPMPPHPRARIRNQYLKNFLWFGRWPKLLWMYLNTGWGKRSLPRMAEIFQLPWLERQKIPGRGVKHLSTRQLKLLVHVIHRFSVILGQEPWLDWESKIALIETHVCLIWGEEDSLYVEGQPQVMQKLFLNSELHMIPDTGHHSMAENPLPVIDVMLKFLSKSAPLLKRSA